MYISHIICTHVWLVLKGGFANPTAIAQAVVEARRTAVTAAVAMVAAALCRRLIVKDGRSRSSSQWLRVIKTNMLPKRTRTGTAMKRRNGRGAWMRQRIIEAVAAAPRCPWHHREHLHRHRRRETASLSTLVDSPTTWSSRRPSLIIVMTVTTVAVLVDGAESRRPVRNAATVAIATLDRGCSTRSRRLRACLCQLTSPPPAHYFCNRQRQ